MQRRIFLFSFLLLLSISSFCQPKELSLIGRLEVKDGGTYSYKLQMNDSSGILSGYSVTDIMGPEETKSAVTGSIDGDGKRIFFRETHLIQTKSKAEELCYIQSHLKITASHGTTVLKGNFTGFKKDGKTVCATGKISLLSTKDLFDILNKIKRKDSIKSGRKEIPETTVVYEEGKEIPESLVLKVKPGDTMTLPCPSSAVTLEVWDAKTIDGDVITLLQDGNTLLENYTLAGMHKTIPVNISNKTTTLTLIAVNEGSEPLNTARIKITSGSKVSYIDATTTIGKNVVFTLKRK